MKIKYETCSIKLYSYNPEFMNKDILSISVYIKCRMCEMFEVSSIRIVRLIYHKGQSLMVGKVKTI